MQNKVVLADLRVDYGSRTLRRADLPDDPMDLFEKWLEEALRAGCPEPNAMTLATVSADGQPSARTVLLKGLTEEGFRFYTHRTSRKGREIAANPRVCLVWLWHEVERQVIVRGMASEVPRAEVEAYFHSRPRASQIGAACSPQSTIIPNRAALEQAAADLAAQYEGKPIPLPESWTGYLVRPAEVEFWQGRPSRMHDRFLYHKLPGQGKWLVDRLAP